MRKPRAICSMLHEAIGATVGVAVLFIVGVWILATVVGAIGLAAILILPILFPLKGPMYIDFAFYWIRFGPLWPILIVGMTVVAYAIGYAVIVGGAMVLLDWLGDVTARLRKRLADVV